MRRPTVRIVVDQVAQLRTLHWRGRAIQDRVATWRVAIEGEPLRGAGGLGYRDSAVAIARAEAKHRHACGARVELEIFGVDGARLERIVYDERRPAPVHDVNSRPRKRRAQ